MKNILIFSLVVIFLSSCSNHVVESEANFVSEVFPLILSDNEEELDSRFIDPDLYGDAMAGAGQPDLKNHSAMVARSRQTIAKATKFPGLSNWYNQLKGKGFSVKKTDITNLEDVGGKYPQRKIVITIGTPDPESDVSIIMDSVVQVSGKWMIVFGYKIDIARKADGVSEGNVYNAILSCGMNGSNINVLACFAKTELKLIVNNQADLYKAYDLQRAGNIYSDGLHIQLPEKFSLVAQNSSKHLILSVVVYDDQNRPVFQDQVGQWGVINVGN